MVSLARYDISYQLNEIEVCSSGQLAASHELHITLVMEHVGMHAFLAAHTHQSPAHVVEV